MLRQKLVIFAKAPRPGEVKSRLAASLGPAAAASAYSRIVGILLDRLDGLSDVQLRFTPEDAFPEIQHWLRPGWHAHPQGPGDLGQRLHSAFADAFAAGAERAVIIGSDCPTLSQDDVRSGWTALADQDVVLGPATDGGYWLIGLRQPRPLLFQNIPWSTNQVLNLTLARARSAGLRIHLLQERGDVDTEKDWREFLQSAIRLA